MDTQRFARHVHGDVTIDMCWVCHAIWFDQYESAQLAPAAVIALFRRIHEHRAQAPSALGEHLQCPRCQSALVLTHDRQRNTRLSYHRCPLGHGRLTTFMQFLREKEFVRSLTAAEVETLKATVSQVRCSSCGALINLGIDVACSYCRAPLAMLDADAVEKALSTLAEADRRQSHPESAEITAAFESILAAYRLAPSERRFVSGASPSPASGALDLIAAGITHLFNG
ncbi:MAG: hypothetical protein IPP90_06910 [Gemmatimonadaceae bacterium]|nr:hypothetical protein [Gemmatimonadaceae bacterium]